MSCGVVAVCAALLAWAPMEEPCFAGLGVLHSYIVLLYRWVSEGSGRFREKRSQAAPVIDCCTPRFASLVGSDGVRSKTEEVLSSYQVQSLTVLLPPSSNYQS